MKKLEELIYISSIYVLCKITLLLLLYSKLLNGRELDIKLLKFSDRIVTSDKFYILKILKFNSKYSMN